MLPAAASAVRATAASTTPRATGRRAPVRALDRWAYKIEDGRLRLVGAYSVNEVEGSGKDAS